jgi:hypothetical protein
MRRGLALAMRALRRPDSEPRAVLRAAADEFRGALAVQGQRALTAIPAPHSSDRMSPPPQFIR